MGILLIVLGVLVSFSEKNTTAIIPVVTSTPPVKEVRPEQVTLSGTYTDCLPRQDNFSAEPCRVGVKSYDASYYVLDYNLFTQAMPTFKNSDRLVISGLFTPIEMLSSDMWAGSIVRGILSVTDIKKEEALTPAVSKPAPKPATSKESASGKCYVGGCSGQICSSEQGMISTCEYTQQYACYKTAKCERQATGKCGWTKTSQLKTCLAL